MCYKQGYKRDWQGIWIKINTPVIEIFIIHIKFSFVSFSAS
ncbi:hypothetical protein XNC1_4338 [Xenorhabdus nematophila ATCC 19061]|uniref:Uncharacterized protein n=1 Tax=Xenorhabdus nematophila (strain ATCC 19061 / DSM 3370 / CCUG 14189 / LMG 1036 / NCIMB 9965 / AN6) TaxID=406817 RepID=D3VEA9_XENNA|nr:hypothetical protein XNC1_4338 [Xenorhabdus nematophila ATCC 19061]